MVSLSAYEAKYAFLLDSKARHISYFSLLVLIFHLVTVSWKEISTPHDVTLPFRIPRLLPSNDALKNCAIF